jgi:serine/threonine protein kinase
MSAGLVCPRCHRTFASSSNQRCPHDGTVLESAANKKDEPWDPMVGRVLDGRFTLIAKLGAGSMGTVYRARQRAMERDVAIKILRRDRALDQASKARFLREARANSALVSPHTVTAFDFGESSTGELFLAMELLEGESLGQRMARIKQLPVPMAIDTARQALSSLAEAHAKGIVHRDLKPDNLFYAKVLRGDQHEEIVKVVDFGVAKMLGEGMGPINAIETQAGTVFGTPRYMSPEQAQAKPLDARSDLYSLGVLLYHMLAGRPPFTDDDAIIVMARHIKTAPKTLSEVAPEANIPPEIEAAVMRALSKSPADRPASAEAMSAELAQALEASEGLGASRASSSSARRNAHASSASGSSLSPDDSLGLPGVATSATTGKRRRVSIGLLAGSAAVVLGLMITFAVRGHGKPPVTEPTVAASGAPIALPAMAVADPLAASAQIVPPPPPPSADAPASPAAPTTASVAADSTRPPRKALNLRGAARPRANAAGQAGAQKTATPAATPTGTQGSKYGTLE